MYKPKELYHALSRDSESTYRQTQDVDEPSETLLYSKNGRLLSRRSHCIYTALILPLLTIVLIQSFWLYHLHWQLHPARAIDLYSSS